MKAPRIRQPARWLADQAVAQDWTGPQYLQAVLEAEVGTREARIRCRGRTTRSGRRRGYREVEVYGARNRGGGGGAPLVVTAIG